MPPKKYLAAFGLAPLAAFLWFYFSSPAPSPSFKAPSPTVSRSKSLSPLYQLLLLKSKPAPLPSPNPLPYSSSLELEKIVDYYFRCEDLSTEELIEQGESISASEDYFWEGENKLWEEKEKICKKRVDDFLAYLQNQGLERFLEVTRQISRQLPHQCWQQTSLLNGLERLGGKAGVLGLLNLPSFTYPLNFNNAQELIKERHLAVRSALDFYLNIFNRRPSRRGMEFILDNSTKEEQEKFIEDLLYSRNKALWKTLFAYQSHTYYEVRLPPEPFWKFYQTLDVNDTQTRIKVLGEIGFEYTSDKVKDIYKKAGSEEKKQILSQLTFSQSHSHAGHNFITQRFQETPDLEELVLLGDTLNLHHNLIEYRNHPHFKKYALEKASQAKDKSRPFTISGETTCGAYCGESVTCKVDLQTEKVKCSSVQYPE